MKGQPSDFEEVNFDPIAYLNRKFPDEESLAGLDQEIESLNAELGEVNRELIEEIHEHAMMNIEIGEEIEKARRLSKEIIGEIGIIKEKAKKSEEIVYDMCKDLKSLDIAKRNLTFSIDALKKFIMMVDAIEKLREACENKQYDMIANLLSAFAELSKYFKKYEQIPQIQSLYKEKNLIVEELFKVIIEDYEAYDAQPHSVDPHQISHAARVIEVLGENYWRKFGQAINSIILKQYEEQYGSPDNAVLENTERRFGFIKRKMEDFNERFGKVLPLEWGMDCLLLYEFCSITRIHLTQILERTASTVSVAILMKALELSIKFENKITDLMGKKYGELMRREKKNKYDLQALPKFAGSISNSFERYLAPYIKSEEETLSETLFKHLEEDKVSELKVYNSALVLFHGIKGSVRRASNFSKGGLLIDILRVVKKMFYIYSERCFEKCKRAEQFEETVCWVVNTGEYCKNIIEGVKEVFENVIDPAFADSIEFSQEEHLFSKYPPP
jgi:vacuolar protein sorting-associated protein 53